MYTEAINHDPAITFMNTGNQQPGYASMGAWVSYGLGSENENLPTFIAHDLARHRQESRASRSSRASGAAASCLRRIKASASAPAPTPCSI